MSGGLLEERGRCWESQSAWPKNCAQQWIATPPLSLLLPPSPPPLPRQCCPCCCIPAQPPRHMSTRGRPHNHRSHAHTHLVEVEDQVQLAHVAKVLVQHLRPTNSSSRSLGGAAASTCRVSDRTHGLSCYVLSICLTTGNLSTQMSVDLNAPLAPTSTNSWMISSVSSSLSSAGRAGGSSMLGAARCAQVRSAALACHRPPPQRSSPCPAAASPATPTLVDAGDKVERGVALVDHLLVLPAAAGQARGGCKGLGEEGARRLRSCLGT